MSEGRVAAEVLLSKTPRPTALLATSDLLAIGAIEVARERGFSVPGDISVIGFDDIPEAAQHIPPLTTVYQPHVEKGLAAGRILIAQLGGEGVAHSEVLPTRLVVRGSTAEVKRA